jgi:hypothetical protein
MRPTAYCCCCDAVCVQVGNTSLLKHLQLKHEQLSDPVHRGAADIKDAYALKQYALAFQRYKQLRAEGHPVSLGICTMLLKVST